MKIKTLLPAILMICTTGAFSQIIHVPADQPTIQAGIDVATTGDTVLVAQGTYFENINFNGKAITVASHWLIEPDSTNIYNAIIDGSQPVNPDYSSVVTFITGEDTTSVLCGFTITGGSGMYLSNDNARVGGGIVCYFASAKIIHNIIEGNEVNYSNHAWGAGIASIKESGNSWTVVTDNIVRDNQSVAQSGTATGGGMEIWGNARISNNLIEDNHCTSISGECLGGGVIHASINNPSDSLYFVNNIVRNNTILSNNSWVAGGGIDLEGTHGFVTNNIFEYNQCEGTYSQGGGIKANNASVRLTLNTIRYNQITSNDGSYGGGVSLWYSESYIADNEISHNTATSYEIWGGGVHLFHPGTLNFEGNTVSDNKVFTENVCAGAGVACIYAEDISTFRNNIFIGNAGPIYSTFPQLVNYGSGGGLFISGADENEIIIVGNIFKADTAKYGGGLSIKHSFNVKTVNNLFVDNKAYYGGGVDIVNIDWKGKEVFNPQFTNNTFFSNSTENNGYAGAMYLRCEFNLPPVTFNNIFYENQSSNGNDIYLYNNSDTVLIAYSNIDPANIAGNSPWKEFENINEDPMFVNSGDYPYQINDYSPCIDAGTPDATGLNLPEVDLAGEPRIFKDRVDIGAYEWNTFVGVNEFEDRNSKPEVRTYPNPFSISTTIEYELQQPSTIQITVYNHLGEQVSIIVEKAQTKGKHQLTWSAENLPVGIYYCVLRTNKETKTTKMIKIK